MRRFYGVVAVLVLAGAGLFAPPRALASEEGIISGAYIVTLVDGASPAGVANEHARNHNARVSHIYRYALRGYAARMSSTAAARVARDSRVRSVVADRVVWATGKPPKSAPPAQTTPTGVQRINGPRAVSGATVAVAVLDTGIDLDHPDLNVNRTLERNCTTERNTDDGNGHGTHVAGTIGAIDNEIGVVGVAPGFPVVPVKVLTRSGSGSWSSVICGIDWVTDNASNIKVANMSLGGSGSDIGCSDGGMHQAICESVAAGVTYAVAAGNSSDNSANHVPAAYSEVITVSALADFDGKSGGLGSPTCRTDEDDTFANFSNYGGDVDLIAPGVCINSTWKGGGYNTISGTSMASPHVAGAAALYKANNAGASPSQVKSALQNAGNTGWNDVDDPDNTKETLLNVDLL